MKTAKAFFAGAALGASAVYWLDPRLGARRRALLRDKAVRKAGVVEHVVQVGTRDLSHRLHGAVADTRARARIEEVPDDVLEARVRAALGHVCSHPHAVKVRARDGLVELKGPILERELSPLVDKVCRIRGVRAIDNDLEAHAAGTRLSSLQGDARVRTPGPRGWTPATRLIVAWTGLATLAVTAKKMLGTVAALLAASSVARRSARRRSSAASRLSKLRKEPEKLPAREGGPADAIATGEHALE